MSVAACQAKCDSLTGCTGIVVFPSDSNGNVDCYRKGDIQLDKCDTKTGFNTYVKSEWTKAKGFNCWGPRGSGASHGAFDLEHPETASAGNMSLAACQQLCKETSGCEGVTVQPLADGTVSCFRKGYIKLQNCAAGSDFDTYVHDVTFYN